MTTVRIGQVWRDNLAECPVTVTDVVVPTAAGPLTRSVEVRYANGHSAMYASGYFDQSGLLGFTRITREQPSSPATPDQRFGGESA